MALDRYYKLCGTELYVSMFIASILLKLSEFSIGEIQEIISFVPLLQLIFRNPWNEPLSGRPSYDYYDSSLRYGLNDLGFAGSYYNSFD